MSCGSNVRYVRAAVALLRAEDATLLHRVTEGRMPLLVAAAEAKRLAALVDAYRRGDASDLAGFALMSAI